MENKNNFWFLNFAFIFSIFFHIYIIFFFTKPNISNFSKTERVTINLSAIGLLEEAPKESIKKEKIKKKEIQKIKKKKK
tara:strand:+ start:1833 stop:2069 length:237 start_codon:yes stop_codon:yes gene_type:complete